ncbi:hypothetical protein AB5J56_18875 [Streptomyces sp. R21]|uniref:DUF11 domain-containing protein n=1 Tax=Streptomyces sp. R21 TaxID=3238627 RepID=A0AB39PC08_9ACTN
MPFSPSGRRTSRTAIGALSAGALLALGAASAAVADEAAPDLLLGSIAPVDGVKPGSSFDVPVTVTNKGTKAADKAWVVYSVTRGLDFAEVPSNCAAHHIPSYDEMTEKSNIVCEFDQAVEPGVVYAPEKPLAVKVLDRALYDKLRMTLWSYDPPLDDAATKPVQGTGPAVKLVEQSGGGSDVAGDAIDVPVTSVNTADFQVSGAHLKGAVGDTVTMQVKFTNAGPAWVLRSEKKPPLRVAVTPPAGTSVVKGDGFCSDKPVTGTTYSCGTAQRWVNDGEVTAYTFKLKIDKKVAGAKGSIALSDETRPFDADKTNDKAAITLDVAGSGSTGGSTTGGSGTGGSDTGGSSSNGGSTGGSSSTGGTGSASTGGSTGGSSSTGGTNTTTTGGDLASTGSGPALPLAGAAAAAVATGAATVLVVRRRRQAQNRA